MEILSKIKEVVNKYSHELYLGSCGILIAIVSYNFGASHVLNTTAQDNNQLIDSIYNEATLNQPTQSKSSELIAPTHTDLRVVVSKASKGRLYHFSWCSGAKRIKESNKLWFKTESAAIAAGYTLAGNCQK